MVREEPYTFQCTALNEIDNKTFSATVRIVFNVRGKRIRRGVDEPERSGAAFRYLLFIRSGRSGTYCQISRNALYLAFRQLFRMGGNIDYEFITTARLLCMSSAMTAEKCRFVHLIKGGSRRGNFCSKTLVTTPPSKILGKLSLLPPPRKFLENYRYYPPSKILGKLSLLPPSKILKIVVTPPPLEIFKATRLNTDWLLSPGRQGSESALRYFIIYVYTTAYMD